MLDVPGLSMKSHEYSPLESEDGLEFQPLRLRKSWLAFILKFAISILLFTVACVSGFFAGRWSAFATDESDDILHLTTFSRVFEYDATYGEPSNTSNAIWRSLIPHHGGFFNHPTIAPERSVFSVFHQLHCLDGMRKGFWELNNALNGDTIIDEENILKHAVHFKHCSDYLRQVLMCKPDMTLEIQNPILKAVEGFGVEHICRDWAELTRFVKEWETWGSN
ncbi:uncharacterized protein CC84DRAFT_1222804 [Paraphaeosphaeria sporulosa]|uniref:Uncharacterized protein n=1 Tax=Paraphaeosphaeria sporulosa TaxID=1460663 RepID=A0A177BZ40_9PLEO|nr:uncharacterized protein CC84DRAFT_1222804 [Paraphaeosphaeria sporulosa]OAF99797.1 hypothetical protein CC84DRAFT_1222804 [Paraphaeosphaeria sporulosa]